MLLPELYYTRSIKYNSWLPSGEHLKKLIMEIKYNTIWRRFHAGILDGLIFLPLAFIQSYFGSRQDLPVIITAAWLIIYTFSRPVYTIAMHSNCGQTIGKKAMGVILLNVDETATISFRQSVLREFPALIILAVFTLFKIYIMLGNTITPTIQTLLSIFSGMNFIWFLLEIITALTNSKRRALHDLIAGSVAIRKEYMFQEKFPEHPEQFQSEEAA
jgi:uncharacterized RDD family membrane protein YckC